MKIQKLLVSSLFIAIILSVVSSAFAQKQVDFTDISGHWAEETMKNGFSDGLIEGYGDSTLRPDSPITTAQIITILTRLLNASEKADIETDKDTWYYEALQEAAYLGLVDEGCNPDLAMTRQNAFSMMAKAFSLTPAEPNLEILSKFSDATTISDINKPPIAQLISDELVVGYGGVLNPNGSITRAEFLTVLYRLAENYIPAVSLGSVREGGSVISGDGFLFNINLTDDIWFDCSSSNIYLCAVNADKVTIRSHKLSNLTAYGNTNIGRLVLDCGSCTVDDSAFRGSTIDTLQLAGSCTAAVKEDNIRNIEITSKNVCADIGGAHDSIFVSAKGANVTVNSTCPELKILGDHNTITLGPETTVDKIEVCGNSNNIILSTDTEVSSMGICGSSNAITINGYTENISVSGQNNHITTEGKAGSISVTGRGTTLDGGGSAESAVIDAEGCEIALDVDKLTDNSIKLEIERVLKLVTLGYKGNYTQKWAQENDYKDSDKEIWINAKGYSSKTDYLIWVNLSMQRVNIFKGKTGEWKLIHSCIVGTGAPGRGTPPGVYYTTYKNYHGWTTSSYSVKPVIGFKVNTGYAFHSRLYYPGSGRIKDSSIGYPVSHGCIRMYDEDVWFIYNNIPLKTTVVVY